MYRLSTIACIAVLLMSMPAHAQYRQYSKALNAYRHGDFQKTLKHLRRDKVMQLRQAKILKARVYYQLDAYAPILPLLEGMDNLDESCRLALASSYHHHGQYEQAGDLWKTLLNTDYSPIVFNNLSDVYYNTGLMDSSIYYAHKALSLAPFDSLYVFNVAMCYSDNEEASKACGYFFLSSQLRFSLASEYYETENCPSWRNQWLKEVPGEHVYIISNLMFPGLNESLLMCNEEFVLSERSGSLKVKLADIQRTPVGAVFKFTDDKSNAIYRWSDYSVQTEWKLSKLPEQTTRN